MLMCSYFNALWCKQWCNYQKGLASSHLIPCFRLIWIQKIFVGGIVHHKAQIRQIIGESHLNASSNCGLEEREMGSLIFFEEGQNLED